MRLRRLLGGLGVLVAVGAVGAYLVTRPGPAAVIHWLPADAAMLRCGPVGLDEDTLALLRQVPRPDPPSDVFTPDMHPQSLWELGFVEDTPVCAALLAPTTATVQAAGRAPERLAAIRLGLRDRITREAKLSGTCTCEAARHHGVTEFFPFCVNHGRSTCSDSDAASAAMADALADADEAMLSVTLPFAHWRIVGRAEQTDVPVRFFARIAPWHPGGSQLYRPENTEDRANAPAAVVALLGQDDVLGVVVHPEHHSLVVFRSIDDTLIVVDAFTRPPVPEALEPWVRRVDAVRTDRFVNALEPPREALSDLTMDPREGPTFAFRGEALARLDDALRLGALGERVPRPTREAPVVNTVTVQLPLAWHGDGIRIRAELAPAGRAVIDPLAGRRLIDGFGGLEAPVERPTADTRSAKSDAGHVFWNTPIEATWFEGARALPWTLAQLAGNYDHTGTIAEWALDVPAGPIHGVPVADGMQGIKSMLSSRKHVIRGGLEGGSLWLDVSPP